MKCIIDTNVIFSALYDVDSPPWDLVLLAIEGLVEFIAPESVKEELIRNLRNKLHYSEEDIEEAISVLPITWLESLLYTPFMTVAKEYINLNNDFPIIACALALNIDIVTGNKHFFPLQKAGIRVLSVNEK